MIIVAMLPDWHETGGIGLETLENLFDSGEICRASKKNPFDSKENSIDAEENPFDSKNLLREAVKNGRDAGANRLDIALSLREKARELRARKSCSPIPRPAPPG